MKKDEFKNKKVAILITGEIRLPNQKNLIKSISNFDIFISTYKEYESNARILTKNILSFKRNEVLKFINNDLIKINKNSESKITPNIFQWWHLNNLLKEYKKKLLEYDVIFKTRSDCFFLYPVSPKMFNHVIDNCLYMNSDISFYSNTKMFFKIYIDFYEDILKKYLHKNDKYFAINYNNLNVSLKCSLWERNPFKVLSIFSKHDVVREGFINGLNVNLFPYMIFSKNKKIFLKNIEYFVDSNNFDMLKGPYLRNSKPGNIVFGSERFNTLNAINKAIILPFRLPTIGIHRTRINKFYEYFLFPILLRFFKRNFKKYN